MPEDRSCQVKLYKARDALMSGYLFPILYSRTYHGSVFESGSDCIINLCVDSCPNFSETRRLSK